MKVIVLLTNKDEDEGDPDDTPFEEIKELNQTIKNNLTNQEQYLKEAAFHQTLINSGLVKEIKHPTYQAIAERQLVNVEGKPVSETIIEERC